MMLHNKYKGSRLCGFREEDYFCLPYIILYKTCDPGAGPFLTRGALFEQGKFDEFISPDEGLFERNM